jgi:hypothetical protein
MPKFNQKYTVVLTNNPKPKPHQVVAKWIPNGRGGFQMGVFRNGRPFPWPKDLVLILKGKTIAKDIFVHLNAMGEEPECLGEYVERLKAEAKAVRRRRAQVQPDRYVTHIDTKGQPPTEQMKTVQGWKQMLRDFHPARKAVRGAAQAKGSSDGK